MKRSNLAMNCIATMLLSAFAMIATACFATHVPTPPPVVLPTATDSRVPPTRAAAASPATATSAPTMAMEMETPTAAPSPVSAEPTRVSSEMNMSDQAAIQLRYLDMAMNMRAVTRLMGKWQSGEDGARVELGEVLERLELAMGYQDWPPAMNKGMDGLMMSMSAMGKAVKSKDVNAGMKQLADMEKAWDDLVHPFYETWMMDMSNAMATKDEVSLQATQLDLALKVQRLDELVREWNKGDDVARVEASEVLEQIEILLDYVEWDPELKGVAQIKESIEPMNSAVKAKDAAAATQAVTGLNEAYDALAHPFYGKWMMGMMEGMKMSTPLAVQATFLDTAANTQGLIELVEAWNEGEDAARGEAGEKIERLDTLFGYVKWPSELEKRVTGLKQAVSAVEPALTAKDQAAAAQAVSDVEEALDELAHAYYKWLQ